jgi:uncharacterized protein
MVAAFLLGITGSLGHCVGMCSGVTLLLSGQGLTQGWRLYVLHLGRVLAYSVFGAGAGFAGFTVVQFLSYCAGLIGYNDVGGHTGTGLPGLSVVQGGLALLTAVLAIYMALSLIGRVPSPERFFLRITRWWGQRMRRKTAVSTSHPTNNPLSILSMGMLWGCLPCGLVLTALLTAAVTGSPYYGAMTMVAFGLGTWPVALGMGWMARASTGPGARRNWSAVPQIRQAGALVVMLFGVQMALRGLAAWGWVQHFHVGKLMLW